MKPLVIYYSLSGNTQKVAEAIAKACNADIENIRDRKTRTGMFGMLSTIFQTLFSRSSQIRTVYADPGQYDLLILGSPVWIGRLPAPMRSYIQREKGRFNQVAFFCTQGSSGAANVFNSMATLSAKQPVATMEVTDKEIESAGYANKMQTFMQLLPTPFTTKSAKDKNHV
jgi:flavodoxin